MGRQAAARRYLLETGGHVKGEAVLARVAAAWGQRLRRREHVCACVSDITRQLRRRRP